MYEIDPSRLDLAREFRARPLGPHSAELQAVLLRMRAMPITGKYCLIVAKPQARWLLARMTGEPLRPEPVPGHVFTSIAEAEWTIFKLRWQELTGHDLAAALEEEPRQAPVADFATLPADRAILAYADRISAAPGEKVSFKVSCDDVAEYDSAIVRLLAPASGPDDEGFREEVVQTLGSRPGRKQAIHLGSYAAVADGIEMPASFSLELFAWPTLLGVKEQALLACWSAGDGSSVELHLDSAGALAFTLSDGSRTATVSTGVPLAPRHWYRLAASFDAAKSSVRLLQEPVAGHGFSAEKTVAVEQIVAIALPAGPRLVHIAAAPRRRQDGAVEIDSHYNGKIERPLLRRGTSTEGDLLALWDFARRTTSSAIIDISGNGHDGVLVNQPARAMKGRLWDGSQHDWRTSPNHYGAIHFHDDDIADAGWQTDFFFEIPEGLKSGVYAVRLRGNGEETYVPFFVRPGAKAARAPIAFLAPTATYTVYCNNKARFFSPGTELIRGRILDFDRADLQLLNYPLGLSTYCVHADGSGVCYGTRLRPVTNFRPKGRLWNFSEDLFIIDWLERSGLAYDVITDEDLHREGLGLLEPYRTVVTGTHPEYATLEMIDALEAYLGQGGRLIYMGGNGFYWRIAYSPEDAGIIEMRRAEDGTRAWDAEPGEYRMGFTGELGGLWRRQGRPPNRLVGVGFAAQGFDSSVPYRRLPASHDPRAAFIFEGVDAEILGAFGKAGGGAAGEELDSFDVRLGSPRHGLVVASSEGHSPTFQPANDMILVPHSATGGQHNPAIRADMVFFECPNGGAVFSTGSIAYAAALGHNDYDNEIARLTDNVLRRFVDPTPFEMP
ncbi:N,N-dimethylformamidase beta subunit family domain-containing protein [Labrys neptuniae]